MRLKTVPLLLMTMATLASTAALAQDLEALKRQVWNTECEFAASMAKRDLAGFERLLADNTLFFSGPKPLHGKAAVKQFWQRFYEGAEAPFRWEPDQVEVLADGTLAHSTGPVWNPKGELTGRFFSVWRQEAPGRWRIVMDRGGPPTEADKARAEAPRAQCAW
ncbi:nuclear transport factor 2 family protein [Pelomonas sp. SE-A7]|uniref:YybH family protein n=1 Tax=Pelomonas sp. SE-A7 TaxID=3054953 RepID=UPI00259CA4D6|nr:nuclear transport factor 2 family protein [Pelomonas sp. SE-A7]MDM4764919.1 nuclear transport factor 2 family protein [Pelomonas sp. SE-A7]